MNQFEIREGDALAVLREMPDESVDMCVTSPPYFGLRDYKVAGQIGLESTPKEFIEVLVEVFHEVKRVLKGTGTCWVNIGDSYAGSWGAQSRPKTTSESTATLTGSSMLSRRQIISAPKDKKSLKNTPGCKSKDLIGIPWMLAFALRDDGWYLRQEIIWDKKNPMPESVVDRCTQSHEHIFLLAKERFYYFDQEAILEPISGGSHMRLSQHLAAQIGSHRANGGATTNGPMKAVGRKAKIADINLVRHNSRYDATMSMPVTERNKRSVWTVGSQGFKGAHFATFPFKLVEPCILAGCPEGGIVLDPFAGAATTGVVALRHNRKFIGIELSPEYCEMGRERILDDNPMFNRDERIVGL